MNSSRSTENSSRPNILLIMVDDMGFSDGYLDEYGREDRPFFLYVAYTAPHYPLHAWPRDIAKYKGKYKVGWDRLREQRLECMVEMGLIDERWALSARDPDSLSWEEIEDRDV